MKISKILLTLILSVTFIQCSNGKKEKENVTTEEITEVEIVEDVVEDAVIAEMIRPESLSEDMNMYVIEREIPGVGDWTAEELKAASQTSCGVLKEMGSDIQWLHSYVTADKLYCVYLAPNEEIIREHAVTAGFPANSVSAVATIISPETAELDE